MTTGPDEPPQEPQEPQQPPGAQGPPQPPGWQGPPPPPPPGYAGGPPPRPYAQPPLRPDEEKTWAIAAHLGPLLLGFIAPLVVWLVYRERSMFLDRTGKEALNFQLTLLLGYLASFVLMCVFIGFVLIFVVYVVGIVFMVLATISVSRFEDYRYPVTIRFIK